MNISPDEVFALLGMKEAELAVLRREIATLTAKISTLEEQLKKHESSNEAGS